MPRFQAKGGLSVAGQLDLLEQAGQNSMREFARASNQPPSQVDELAKRRLFNEGQVIAKELESMVPGLKVEFFC